jgi:hypothetical protein
MLDLHDVTAVLWPVVKHTKNEKNVKTWMWGEAVVHSNEKSFNVISSSLTILRGAP